MRAIATLWNRFRLIAAVALVLGVGLGSPPCAFADATSATDVAIDSSGRLLAVGTDETAFALARYRPDGMLDPHFGSGGTVTTRFFRGTAEEAATSVAIERSGKFVVAGDTCCRKYGRIVVARYRANGALDRSFSHDGKANVDLGRRLPPSAPPIFQRENEYAVAVAADSKGRIIVAGGDGRRFVLMRFRADGRLDSAFGDKGVAATSFNLGKAVASGAAIDAGGRIVVAGYAGPAIALARYRPNGTLDRTFGAGGKVTSDFTPDAPNGGRASALAIGSAGRIVVAGTYPNRTTFQSEFAVARYKPDGRRDPTFGTGGVVMTDFGSDAELRAVAIDPAGDIVAAGYCGCVEGGVVHEDVAVARYRPNGSRDGSFGSGGEVTSVEGLANSVAIDPGGAIVIAGDIRPGDAFGVGRLTPRGSPDPTFGTNGFVTTSFPSGVH